MLEIRDQILRTGTVAVSTDTDNATATATATPHTSTTSGAQGVILATGVRADFSAAVTAVKAITITFTDVNGVAQTEVYRWDFSLGPFVVSFPGILTGLKGTAVVATLAASGTGGTTGRVSLYFSETG